MDCLCLCRLQLPVADPFLEKLDYGDFGETFICGPFRGRPVCLMIARVAVPTASQVRR